MFLRLREGRYALVDELQKLVLGGSLLVAEAARRDVVTAVPVSDPELFGVLRQTLVQYGIEMIISYFPLWLGRQVVANLLELV